jgi:hypothetical protein
MTFIASRNATETHDLQNCLPIILGRLLYTYYTHHHDKLIEVSG